MDKLARGRYLDQIDECIEDAELIITRSLYVGDQGQNERHCHDNTHLTLILSGGYREWRRQGASDALPGELLFYHAGEYHQSLQTRGGSRNLNLEIDPHFFSGEGLTETALATAVAGRPEAKFLFFRMYRELVAGDADALPSIRLLLLQLVDGTRPRRRSTPSWIPRVEEWLRAEWDSTVSLHELSIVAQVHPVTLSRQFHAHFACTLGEFRRKLKVEKAIALMTGPTPRPLTEIAHTCGFADQSHFTRCFKTLTGFVPQEYQKLSLR